MRHIAKFLQIEIDEAKFPIMVEHCTFENMQRTAPQHWPIMDFLYQTGVNTFFNKGTNGRWRDILTPTDLQKYDEVVAANLSKDCAHWLVTAN